MKKSTPWQSSSNSASAAAAWTPQASLHVENQKTAMTKDKSGEWTSKGVGKYLEASIQYFVLVVLGKHSPWLGCELPFHPARRVARPLVASLAACSAQSVTHQCSDI